MEDYRTQGLRLELEALLRRQHELLETRMLGALSDADLLEYEIRQVTIHEICNELANGVAA
jgi:hypothetical protein